MTTIDTKAIEFASEARAAIRAAKAVRLVSRVTPSSFRYVQISKREAQELLGGLESTDRVLCRVTDGVLYIGQMTL